MRNFFLKLFDDNLGGEMLEIKLFNCYHFLYLILIFGSMVLLAYLLKNKSKETQRKVIDVIIISVIVSQVLDLFAMPLYMGKISMDKLPFHVCTSMSIATCIAHFSKHFKWLEKPSVILGIMGSLMYITYPGTALGGVSAISYRVVQTFFFHGGLLVYGVLQLATGQIKIEIKKVWQDLLLLLVIVLWASFGNALYNSEKESFDWFFLTGGTFPFIPKPLMPLTVIVCTSAMIFVIYGIYYLVKHIISKRADTKAAVSE